MASLGRLSPAILFALHSFIALLNDSSAVLPAFLAASPALDACLADAPAAATDVPIAIAVATPILKYFYHFTCI
jgi:hypothetical protein